MSPPTAKRQTEQTDKFVRSRQFLHRRGHVPALQGGLEFLPVVLRGEVTEGLGVFCLRGEEKGGAVGV